MVTKCDDRCRYANGPISDCDCECMGANHGALFAGRKLKPIKQPGSNLNSTATFYYGRTAVVLSDDPETAKQQAETANKGGPIPMPKHWVGFDPAAIPQHQPRHICLNDGQTFGGEYEADQHSQKKRHSTRFLSRDPS